MHSVLLHFGELKPICFELDREQLFNNFLLTLVLALHVLFVRLPAAHLKDILGRTSSTSYVGPESVQG